MGDWEKGRYRNVKRTLEVSGLRNQLSCVTTAGCRRRTLSTLMKKGLQGSTTVDADQSVMMKEGRGRPVCAQWEDTRDRRPGGRGAVSPDEASLNEDDRTEKGLCQTFLGGLQKGAEETPEG
ncbi:uncharacterized protein AAES06_019374 isoform 1-T1 [Glossophaga mutica]